MATILAMGGRVTSESVVTEGGGGAQPYGPEVAMSRDMGMSYPYPWYPSGPGIWLTVQVPVDDYDKAMEAARDAGEVVQMQQSTYDVGAQVADVDARIKALEASLVRLDGPHGRGHGHHRRDHPRAGHLPAAVRARRPAGPAARPGQPDGDVARSA